MNAIECRTMKAIKKLTLVSLISLSLATAGCSEVVTTHGQVINSSLLNNIRIGVDDKESVQSVLGSPSAIGTFADKRWYYVTETAVDKPLNPNILEERNVLIIEFDESNKVASLRRLDESDGRQIEPSTRVTPTQGQSLGILDQLLDNLGTGF